MLKAVLRASPSLRRVLVLPYILLVLALALAIGLPSYQAGSRAVESMAQQLLRETVERLGEAVKHHLGGSAAVLEAAFPNDMPAPLDLRQGERELIQRFWIATSLHLDPNNYAYYGNHLGQAFGLYRRSRHEAELRVKYDPAEHRTFYRMVGMAGAFEDGRREEQLFDPRTRPWYHAAQQSLTHVWTSVYIDFGTRDLVATRARSVRSASGEFEGVVATDVPLKALNHFIRELKPSANGLVLLIEPDGLLVASATGSNIVLDRHIGAHRRGAWDDESPLARTTYAELRKVLARAGDDGPTRAFTFTTQDGQDIHAAFDWVRDEAGLAWITLVAIPRSDFMGQLTDSLKLSGISAVVAVLVALLLGLALVRWVVVDIARLSEAAQQVAQGRGTLHLRIRRRDEIGQLAKALESMHLELSTDQLTGLSSRQALMRQLEYAIHRQRQQPHAAAGFAVLFIDLNRFKAINDTYGHEAGDLALIEAAQRLREAVRLGDLVARLGGDEFVIVLWRTTHWEDVQRVCEKIAERLSAPLVSLAHLAPDIRVGAAVGAAIYPHDGEDADSLLQRADQNMYREKHGPAA